MVASALIRRVTLSLADRNEWQRDVGLEFQVTGSDDRDAVARIREFVLALERFQLSRRVDLSGARPGRILRSGPCYGRRCPPSHRRA